jgi:DNA-binding HxlR family transcriptional regulator/putative sterol carrier protein
MATKRTYGDGCAIARGLDVIGERWALLVVRELLLGPKRYTDLKKGLPNASPNVLSERLRELEQAGVVRRGTLPPPASSRVYELTDWGRGLEGIVVELGRWTASSPLPPSEGPIGSDSVALALRTLFDPAAAKGLKASYQLRLGDDRFRVEVSNGEIEVERGEIDDPNATIETDPATFGSVLWEGLSLAAAQRAGELSVEGDAAAADRLIGLFPMPATT